MHVKCNHMRPHLVNMYLYNNEGYHDIDIDYANIDINKKRHINNNPTNWSVENWMNL